MSRHDISKRNLRSYEHQPAAGRGNSSGPSGIQRFQVEGRGIPEEEYVNYNQDIGVTSSGATARPQERERILHRGHAGLIGQRVKGILKDLPHNGRKLQGYLYINGSSEPIYLHVNDVVPEPNLPFTEETNVQRQLVKGSTYEFEVYEEPGRSHLQACEAVCLDDFDPTTMRDYSSHRYWARVDLRMQNYSFVKTPEGVQLFLHHTLVNQRLHDQDTLECKVRYIGVAQKKPTRYEVTEVCSIQSAYSYAMQELSPAVLREMPDALQGEADYIPSWNAGFIYPADGGPRIYFRYKAIQPIGELPRENEPVAYSASGMILTDQGWRVNKVLILRRFQ